MTPKIEKSSSHAVHVPSKPTTKKRSAMSTKIEKSVSAVADVSSTPIANTRSAMSNEVQSPAIHPTLSTQPATPAVEPTPVVATTTPVASAPRATNINPPPKGFVMPAVPADYSPAQPGEFATVVPRNTELTALSLAVTDLASFTNYAETLGATAPPLDEVREIVSLGAQWSTMREASSKWDGYASLQEGLSWKLIRTMMDTLRPSFALAAKLDPTLPQKYAGLAKLLGAKQAIAHKAAAVRRANRKATAAGEPALHGKVGKKRQRALEKASLAAQSAAAAPVVTPAVATTGGGSTGGAVAAPALASPANGAVNGAGH